MVVLFGVIFFCAVGALCFHIFIYVKVTEWPPTGKIAAH